MRPGAKKLLLREPSPLLSADFCRRIYKSNGGGFPESLITVSRTNPPDVYTLNRAGVPVGPFGGSAVRISDRGLSAWIGHSQIFRNSNSPATQTRTVTNGVTYYVTAWNCTIVLSGAATGTITGGPSGQTLAVTASGTSLTFTVSSVVAPAFAQCEQTMPQPPIIAAGATVTSGVELNSLDLNNFSWWSNLKQFTVLCAYEPTASVSLPGAMWEIEDGAGTNRISTNFIASSQTGTTFADGTTTIGYDPPLPFAVANRLQVYGAAIDLLSKTVTVCLYDAVQGMSPSNIAAVTPSPTALRYLHFGGQASGIYANGYIRGLDIVAGYHSTSLPARAQRFYQKFI